jgi:ribonuclease HII
MASRVHERLAAFDRELVRQYGAPLCGVDEAGRGAWAGPIVAAAAILVEGACIEGLNDSKKLDASQRGTLEEQIKLCCLGYGVASVEASEIDRRGIDACNVIVMTSAAEEARRMAGVDVSMFIVDQSPGFRLQPHTMLAKADATSLCVAAASVLAKVARDKIMEELGREHPRYGMEESKGYITQHHKDAVLRHGVVLGVHRTSFSVAGVNRPRQLSILDFDL